MATTIKYTNPSGEELTEAQIEYTPRLYREIYEDNIKKIVEVIKNGKLHFKSYYLSSGENVASILPQYRDKEIGFVATAIQNGYTLEVIDVYKNSILDGKVKSVEDSNGRSICFQRIDITTGLPDLASTEKTYFNGEGIQTYSFEYNPDGSCFMIYDKNKEEHTLGATVGQPGIDFSWTGFEYYQFAMPLVPN